jgi:hypothetical protein
LPGSIDVGRLTKNRRGSGLLNATLASIRFSKTERSNFFERGGCRFGPPKRRSLEQSFGIV